MADQLLPSPTARLTKDDGRPDETWYQRLFFLFAAVNALQGLTGTATYDPGNLVDGAGETTTVTVTGAALGNFAEVSFSLDLQGVTLTAWVSADDTVSVRFQNETGGAIDLGSGTLTARVRI
jgi:hypothetical protein